MSSILYDKYDRPITHKSALSEALIGVDNERVLYYDIGSNQMFSKHPAIFRTIELCASVGSSIPTQLYKGKDLVPPDVLLNGVGVKGFDINNPSPSMSLNEFLYRGLVYYYYRGEFLAMYHTDIFRLEILDPKKGQKLKDGSWHYNDGHRNINIPFDQVIYMEHFDPDSDRGISVADIVKGDVENYQYAQKYNTEMFKHYGKIGGWFEDTTGNILPDDMQKFVSEYNQKHAGARNAGKILGLPGGLKYIEPSNNMRDMEYGDGIDRTRDTIFYAFGVHKALMGITDQVNRSVSEEATRMFILHNIKPTLIRLAEKINQTLFRRIFPGYKLYFDFSEVPELKDSVDTMLKQAETYMRMGYTINEINEKFDLGMPEINDPIGNMRFISNSLVSVDDLLYEEESAKEKDNKVINNMTTKLVEYYDQKHRTNSKVISTYKYTTRYNKLTSKWEKVFVGKIRKYFVEEVNGIVKILLNQKNIKSVDINTVLSLIQNEIESNKSTLSLKLGPVYNEASMAADEFAILFSAEEAAGLLPAASEAVVQNMISNISGISKHTYRLVRTQVKDGVNAGESVDQIAQRISNIYRMNISRSRIIAQTEVAGVVNRTADERYKKQGVKQKMWLTAGGGKVRDSHAANAALGNVAYDFIYPNGQRFPNDGAGGAAENISCRCTIIPVL